VINATHGFTPPSLSDDDWSGRPTGRTLASEIVDRDVIVNAPMDELVAIETAVGRAWEEAGTSVWDTALHAVAHRTLGNIPEARSLERACETMSGNFPRESMSRFCRGSHPLSLGARGCRRWLTH
jgi:hypothetical protein